MCGQHVRVMLLDEDHTQISCGQPLGNRNLDLCEKNLIPNLL